MKKVPHVQKHGPDTLAEQTACAQQVLRTEAEAISRIVIDESFHRAVDLILEASSGGALVVSGLGKSGLIGQKLSATFASTGTPSHFMHPVEAMHGDLGRVRRGDVVLLLSFGGNTDEVLSLAAVLQQDSVPVITITGKVDCDLARLATVSLCVGDVAEACPLNLAPTASTTAMLALGDALALCVSRRRNFGVDDFKKRHPGGALGRQLMPVVEIIRFRAGTTLPLVLRTATIQEGYRIAQAIEPHVRRAGALVIVNDDNTLAGIFTDGDLRRLVFEKGAGVLEQPIENVMTRNPRHLQGAALVRDAVQMIREHRIDELPVVNENGVVLGLVDVQDLVALKVIEG